MFYGLNMLPMRVVVVIMAILGATLDVTGVVSDYWSVYDDNIIGIRGNIGLWRDCIYFPHGDDIPNCDHIASRINGTVWWRGVTASFALSGLALAGTTLLLLPIYFMSHPIYKRVKFWIGAMLTSASSAVLTLVAVLLFGTNVSMKMNSTNSESYKASIGWSFIVTLCAGTILTLTSLILFIERKQTRRSGWTIET